MEIVLQKDEQQMRIDLSFTPSFQQRVLSEAITVAHQVMNEGTTSSNAKLKAKCVELLNNPDSFKDRLALSAAALLPLEEFNRPRSSSSYGNLRVVVLDVLDAIAGQGA